MLLTNITQVQSVIAGVGVPAAQSISQLDFASLEGTVSAIFGIPALVGLLYLINLT